MNSERLMNSFKHIYQQFFTQYHTVISMPFVFDWTGNNRMSNVSIKQKIPLRLYV